MDLEGARLGKYELQAEIGRGDLGVVYRGYDPDAARPVAVKLLNPHLTTEDDFAQRFPLAVQAAGQLHHPSIVAVYDNGKADDRYYYVMEYLDGQPLDQLLREQEPLPSNSALLLLHQMADALDHAHAQGLVHGGVKPSNVIIIGRKRVIMTDFGFERPVQTTGLVVKGTSISSLYYVSPEQANGETIETASDLYSLAVIAYEMLAGFPPFGARSASDILYQHIHEPPPPLLLERPELSPAVDEVFNRALSKQTERRYGSGTDFVTSLARALRERSSVVALYPPPTPPAGQTLEEPTSTPLIRALRWRGFAGVVLIIIALVAGALALSAVIGRPEPTPTLNVVAVLTEVANPVPATTPTRTIAPVTPTATPRPEPTVMTALTVNSPASGEPGSIATVQIPVADVRAAPSHGSERVTQVIMGEKVMLQEKQDGWFRITAVDQPSPKDAQGYPGWLEADAVSLESYEPAQIAIVMVPTAALRSTPTVDGPKIHDLSLDSRLALQSATDAWVAVSLPDGNEGWIAREHVRLVCPDGKCEGEVAGAPDQRRAAQDILKTALQFLGTPYLWGGTSAAAFDCSGFVYRVLHANGISLPRDSLPMSQNGTWVERNELQPGDIIFTAGGGPEGRVSHCALYLGDGQVLTTVGIAPITIVPLDNGRFLDEYWGARRYP